MSIDAIHDTTEALLHLLRERVAAAGRKTAVASGLPTEDGGSRLNLHLLHVRHDEHRRQPAAPFLPPRGSPANALPPPPQLLRLTYLLTPIIADELAAQRLLGLAMRALHEHPRLSIPPRGELQIIPLDLDLAALREVWPCPSAPRRASAAYEVAPVVLGDTDTPPPLPLVTPL